MGNLYDTHFHLDLQPDLKMAITEINDNHIYTIAVTNLPDLYRKGKQEVNSSYIRLALGFHPELVSRYKHQIPLMWELLPNARYIGEVGLDFSSDNNKMEQIDFFEQLVGRIINDSSKIISIHSRRSVSTVLDIISSNFSFKPILHWFTGSSKELDIAIDRGYYISVNQSMIQTNKGRCLLSQVPKSQLLLETDSPFIGNGTQVAVLRATYGFLDPDNTGFLWENFKRLLKPILSTENK